MKTVIETIPLLNLAVTLIPVILVIVILVRWSLRAGNAVYAFIRMVAQLLLIGYLLTYIFESDSASIVLAILTVMVLASSWIALGSVKEKRITLFKHALCSIALCGGLTLAIVTQAVVRLDPWFCPQYMIPLAGMIFANAMNSVSLAAERLQAEIPRTDSFAAARNIAFQASLIPIVNSLFAVGLVSLPGMMTGQILSGVSPLIAVRYQIMVMCMLFGASGLSVACFLTLTRKQFVTGQAA